MIIISIEPNYLHILCSSSEEDKNIHNWLKNNAKNKKYIVRSRMKYLNNIHYFSFGIYADELPHKLVRQLIKKYPPVANEWQATLQMRRHISEKKEEYINSLIEPPLEVEQEI